ncbi:MAG: RidA family protein [Acidimicrobiales bacterium]
MTNRPVMPASLAPPAAAYAHAVVSDLPQRMLHTSGVVPVAPDGTTPDGVGDQADLVWKNIGAMLSEVEMSVRDIVSVTTYAVNGEDLQAIMQSRDRMLSGHLAASTLVTVPALAEPAWRVEIAVVAVA